MKKQILKFILTAVFLIALTIPTMAAELDLEYSGSADYSDVAQGTNSWFYQVKKEGKYYDMEYDTALDMLKWRKAELASGNYITAKMMHPGSGNVATARVWEAPYSGVVTLTPNGNVCKSGIGGDGITLRIFKNTELIWEQFLEGTDNVGYTYSLRCDVLAGDRVYFEIDGGVLDHYGATIWDPYIKYIQAACFSVGGTKVKSTSDLKNGNVVECTLYDGEKNVKGDALMYIVAYDKLGRLRNITAPKTVNLDNSVSRTDIAHITMSGEESFENWKISLHVLTSEAGRYYRSKLSTLLNLE